MDESVNLIFLQSTSIKTAITDCRRQWLRASIFKTKTWDAQKQSFEVFCQKSILYQKRISYTGVFLWILQKV